MIDAVLGALGAVADFLGWQIPLGVALGMGLYHQMVKRSPRLLAWVLSGVKNAGDAAKDAING